LPAVPKMPIEGESFASSIVDAAVPSKSSPQYFEMFGHRGVWHDGWKAVAYHPPGTPFENDTWELFHLKTDFSEVDDLAGPRARAPRRHDRPVVG
jgi:arylsulfatase A-like enzyme